MSILNIAPTLEDLPPSPDSKAGWPWTEQSEALASQRVNSSKHPYISIVTPSYNQGSFIEATIRSVLLQGYPNLEYIVIDGGSSDETVAILKRYSPWLSYWISEPDRGQAHAINKGFSRAKGEIFGWLNSDDIFMENALFKVAEEFQKKNFSVLVGNGQKVLEDGKVAYSPAVPELNFKAFLNWMDYSHFMQPSCFFTREAWLHSGPLREDLHYCMDLDLWLKISQKFNFSKLDHLLSQSTVHGKAKTTAERERMTVETCLLLIEYGGEAIARKKLLEMADALFETRKKVSLIANNPLYKLLRPIYSHWR